MNGDQWGRSKSDATHPNWSEWKSWAPGEVGSPDVPDVKGLHFGGPRDGSHRYQEDEQREEEEENVMHTNWIFPAAVSLSLLESSTFTYRSCPSPLTRWLADEHRSSTGVGLLSTRPSHHLGGHQPDPCWKVPAPPPPKSSPAPSNFYLFFNKKVGCNTHLISEDVPPPYSAPLLGKMTTPPVFKNPLLEEFQEGCVGGGVKCKSTHFLRDSWSFNDSAHLKVDRGEKSHLVDSCICRGRQTRHPPFTMVPPSVLSHLGDYWSQEWR